MGSVASAINSERGVTLSRLSMILTPLLFTAFLAIALFVINGKFDDLSHTEARVTAVENTMADMKSKLDTLAATNALNKADQSANQATTTQTLSDIKSDVSKMNSNVATLSSNVAAMGATLDLLKSRFVSAAARPYNFPPNGYDVARSAP